MATVTIKKQKQANEVESPELDETPAPAPAQPAKIIKAEKPTDVPEADFDTSPPVQTEKDRVTVQFTTTTAAPIVGNFKFADKFNVTLIKAGSAFTVPRYVARTLIEKKVAVATV